MPDLTTFIGNYYTAYVPNDEELISLGHTVVRFYVATSENGSYSLSGTDTLAAGQFDYSHNDTDGLATDWWYWAPYGAVTGEGPASEPQPAGVQRVTRKMVRQGVGRRLRMLDVHTLTSVTDADTAVISALIDPDASPHRIANRFARVVAGTAIDQTRRVRAGTTGYVTSTGTLNINRATSPAWVADDEVELWVPRGDQDPSAQIDEAMNRAALELFWEETFYFTADESVTEYAMPAAMKEHFVKRVDWANGIYPSEPRWTPVPALDFAESGGTLYLSVGTSPERWRSFSQGTVFRVVFNRWGDRMDADEDYWEVDREWAIAETAAKFLGIIVSPNGGREDTSDAARSSAGIEIDLANLRRVHMPRPGAMELAPR